MDFIRCVPLGNKTVSNRAHPQRLLGRDRPVRLSPVALSRAGLSALRRTGTPHIYHLYEGEGHGWRKQETIDHFYRAVEKFLDQHVLMQ